MNLQEEEEEASEDEIPISHCLISEDQQILMAKQPGMMPTDQIAFTDTHYSGRMAFCPYQ